MDVNNISFSYDKNNLHLKNITTEIEKGKITTIIGPNGSGKSTLLNGLSRNLKMSEGNINLENSDIQSYSLKKLAKKLAVVHQQNTAPQDMTVERLVAYGRLPYKKMFKTDSVSDEKAVYKALEDTNLLEKRKQTIINLSGGEQQRVWIAMSLAQETPYLFLDEPTTFLDIYYQYEILDIIEKLNKEKKLTIVMVLHDLNQAIRYSDLLIVMNRGEVVTKGAPNEIISQSLIKDIYKVDVIIKTDEVVGMYTIPNR